jgi:hypothetical protein
MQFTFLGNRYEANSSQIPVVESQIGGKYRGQAWTTKHLQKALISQPFHNLKYRGVKYLGFVYGRGKNHSIKFAPELADSKNYPPQISSEVETNEGAMEKTASDNHPVVSN